MKVPAPTTAEVQQLVAHLARTVERWLATLGYGPDEACDEDDDANGVLLSASVAGRTALGARAGAKVRRLQRAQERPFRLPPLCGEAHGYNLHAAVVIRRGNREGLERLCRYVLRPPLARTRLQRRGDGLLVLTLRKPYANGTTDFVFSEVELAGGFPILDEGVSVAAKTMKRQEQGQWSTSLMILGDEQRDITSSCIDHDCLVSSMCCRARAQGPQ